MKVRCECIDSNGNSWPDCSCAHGWLDVPDQPIDWRARAETAERQRDAAYQTLEAIAVNGLGLSPVSGENMPKDWAKYPTMSEHVAKMRQQRDALAAALSTHGKCIQCGGTGSYETVVGMDEDGEIQTEEAQCECRGVDPQAILAARLAAERKAGAVEAIRQLSNAIRSEPHPNHLLFAAIAEGFAKQIERGEEA